MTVTDVLTLALKRINVLPEGGTLEGDQLTDCFALFNVWIDSLSTDRLMIPFIKRTLFTITSTKGSATNPYTVGPGGDVDVAKPSFIDHVNYKNNAVSPAIEIPMTPLTADAYSGIPIKDQTSTLPGSWYYSPTYAAGLGSLFFWPLATQSSLQGVLYAPSAVAQFGAVSDDVIVPAGYSLFLIDGFAVFASPTFRENLPIDPVLVQSARAARQKIETINTPNLDMAFDAAVVPPGSGWRSNIYAGWP